MKKREGWESILLIPTLSSFALRDCLRTVKVYCKHVTNELSAYCHGELSAGESLHVAMHLAGCQSCRGEYEEISLGIRLAERLPLANAPAWLWNEIESLLCERSLYERRTGTM